MIQNRSKFQATAENPVNMMKNEIKQCFERNQVNITGSNEHDLKLIADEILAETRNTLVWKGTKINTVLTPKSIQFDPISCI